MLLLVDSRRRSFTDSVLSRPDIDVLMLRIDSATPVSAPADAPAFVLRQSRPIAREVARFKAWSSRAGLVPTHFCNQDEAAQRPANAFAALLGLAALTPRQVRLVTDKDAMKGLYAELGIPTARHRLVSSVAEVRAFAERAGWPVIVKPTDSGSGIDTWRIAENHDAQLAMLLSRPRRWMVEEYVTGVEYQLCALVWHGRVLDAYVSLNPVPLLEAMDGGMNADITLARSETSPVAARELCQELVTGLGYRDGYLHAEFFFGADGRFAMGELAARLAGAEIATNHGLAYGFDMMGATADLYLGRQPPLAYTLDRSVGDLLLPTGRGHVQAVSTEAELAALPGVIGVELRVKPGDLLDPVRSSSSSSGYVRVAGDNSWVVVERMRRVLDSYRLILTGEPETMVANLSGHAQRQPEPAPIARSVRPRPG